jgi:hypothetical protein
MKDPKYYLLAKSIYDKYVETQEYDNVYDLANKPYQMSDEQIVQDHLDSITSLYFDETDIDDFEWDLVLNEIKEIIELEIDKEF